jgi:GH15 family glucan-1,4-alpha-glucosidase
VALARAGRITAAEAALTFLLGAQVGGYEAEVGVPYGVSICRHYGVGQEWSDVNADGPNIEFDGFGLTLWAAAEVVRAGGPSAVAALQPFAGRLQTVMQSIGALVDGTGLLSPDSSIWEVHWDGQQRHFTYTDAAAVAGLEAADGLAAQLGLPPAGYSAVARGLAQTMQAKLVDPVGAMPGTLEAALGTGDDRDAAAVEAYNLAGLDPSATIAAIETDLLVASGLGYRRDDQGSSYDNSEWAFIDLRLAAADFGMGWSQAGGQLLARVGDAASQAYGLIPELYDPATGDYAGAIPMVGFGAAAYLLALEARAQGPVAPIDWLAADAGVPADAGATPDAGGAADGGVARPPADVGAQSGSDAGSVGPASGCGCGQGSGTSALWLLLVVGGLGVTGRARTRVRHTKVIASCRDRL